MVAVSITVIAAEDSQVACRGCEFWKVLTDHPLGKMAAWNRPTAQYKHALEVVAPRALKHRHVIVSESCVPLVLEAVAALASRLKVKLRSQDILATGHSTSRIPWD